MPSFFPVKEYARYTIDLNQTASNDIELISIICIIILDINLQKELIRTKFLLLYLSEKDWVPSRQ